jgi:L-ascorbate metabolism protein UlaG (beta-lactamase superfamily)
VEIRFLGHACFELTDGDRRVLVDPFLTGNPKAAATADELDPTQIFLTHGHEDHYGDIIDIA